MWQQESSQGAEKMQVYLQIKDFLIVNLTRLLNRYPSLYNLAQKQLFHNPHGIIRRIHRMSNNSFIRINLKIISSLRVNLLTQKF